MDGNISTIHALTEGQLTDAQAAKLLRISNNDVETALNKWFDKNFAALEEPDNVAKEGWDNNVFGADRYGQQEGSNSQIPSFNIEYALGVDHYPHSGAASVAPSRPPSRTSHHSGAPSAQGDTPMQSIENGQESGFIGNTKPVFGPANRDQYYEPSKWAMVPVSSTAEVIPDAVPSQRKREEDGPAIIKPIPRDDYLPALITILHSIPLFRNALLTPEITQAIYTVGENWWKGGEVTQARTVEYGVERETAHELDIIFETQRLMAFLDNTDRAYGSTGGLQQLDAWKESRAPFDGGDDELLKFLLNWGLSYQNQTSNQLNGVLRNMVKAAGDNNESWLLDAAVKHHDSSTDKTLYDVLDDNLFASTAGNAHIVDVSNVIILRLSSSKSDATSLDCKIPSTFYADRYLEGNKAVIDEMFQEMGQYEDELRELDSKVSKLKYHVTKKVRPGERMETLKLLQSSVVAFQPKEEDLIEDPRNAAVLSQLQSVYNNIEGKLSVLEEQKKKARDILDTIASRFRAPFNDGSDLTDTAAEDATVTQQPTSKHPLAHPYKLCGVSTRPGVYYLLHPDTKADEPSAKQWWRIEYSTATGSEAHILRERLPLSSVLEKASKEYKSALIIYANEAALSPAPTPLSEPLRKFVNADNVAFLKELQGDWQGEAGGIEPLGGWADDAENKVTSDQPPTYADDWAHYGGSTIFGYQSAGANAKQNARTQENDNPYKYDDRAGSGQADSGVSSTTLTPNTEMEDDVVEIGVEGGTEMQEVGASETNGGWAAWAGGSSASSETVGGEPMDVAGSQGKKGVISMRDVEMMDVDLNDESNVPEPDHERQTQQIEVLEKKGG